MDRFGQVLHLPDLQFSQLCQQQFSINKGIYNTIDSWFYHNGVINILDRRQMILQFMSIHTQDETSAKFGPGGLSKKLEDFWDKIIAKIPMH
ncbi:hypothetical protein [Lysinibacillus yapensis]|uniref:hypothetical protein n=1 Tax=Ureibacillus yapensis TaxID=2304605 RepID=UPI001F43E2D9|nr:hypothetical protein [Lysinibacillus yapensis]